MGGQEFLQARFFPSMPCGLELQESKAFRGLGPGDLGPQRVRLPFFRSGWMALSFRAFFLLHAHEKFLRKNLKKENSAFWRREPPGWKGFAPTSTV